MEEPAMSGGWPKDAVIIAVTGEGACGCCRPVKVLSPRL